MIWEIIIYGFIFAVLAIAYIWGGDTDAKDWPSNSNIWMSIQMMAAIGLLLQYILPGYFPPYKGFIPFLSLFFCICTLVIAAIEAHGKPLSGYITAIIVIFSTAPFLYLMYRYFKTRFLIKNDLCKNGPKLGFTQADIANAFKTYHIDYPDDCDEKIEANSSDTQKQVNQDIMKKNNEDIEKLNSQISQLRGVLADSKNTAGQRIKANNEIIRHQRKLKKISQTPQAPVAKQPLVQQPVAKQPLVQQPPVQPRRAKRSKYADQPAAQTAAPPPVTPHQPVAPEHGIPESVTSEPAKAPESTGLQSGGNDGQLDPEADELLIKLQEKEKASEEWAEWWNMFYYKTYFYIFGLSDIFVLALWVIVLGIGGITGSAGAAGAIISPFESVPEWLSSGGKDDTPATLWDFIVDFKFSILIATVVVLVLQLIMGLSGFIPTILKFIMMVIFIILLWYLFAAPIFRFLKWVGGGIWWVLTKIYNGISYGGHKAFGGMMGITGDIATHIFV